MTCYSGYAISFGVGFAACYLMGPNSTDSAVKKISKATKTVFNNINCENMIGFIAGCWIINIAANVAMPMIYNTIDLVSGNFTR